jgi:hypothetical protein
MVDALLFEAVEDATANPPDRQRPAFAQGNDLTNDTLWLIGFVAF